ncbi:MAG: hypothetical protein CMB99_06645 [Flavobacteriaceae bacterium]|nr:hypothetical protein [Flavobacteriaceae bacterium]|tara:strand:- start:102819 stop:103688 length:870 start_codon:yes stop_codon:yes gene_type:complete
MKKEKRLFLSYAKDYRNWQARLDAISVAAKKLGIQVIILEESQFDYSTWLDMDITSDDMYYNVTPLNHEIENIFIEKGATTMFQHPNSRNHIFSSHQFDIALINANIPTPKTILKGTNDRDLLEKYIDYLNGFPLIVKATAGTLGIGVIKIETLEGLYSTTDYLMSQKVHFQLKEFVNNEGSVRAIVLGNKVLGTFMRNNIKDDFRCSAPGLVSDYSDFEMDDELEEILLKLPKLVNYDFLGVDIVQDGLGNYYVLEINYPNDFTIPASVMKIDIGKAIVDFLVEKSTS